MKLKNNMIVFEWDMTSTQIMQISKQYSDVVYWCGQNNIQCEYGVSAQTLASIDSTYYFIRFQNDVDLMAFKLRWT